ncbi:NAD(P)H-dependent oxidoreductase [Brucella sp. 21LCYQ03]|nr:NAD(P)H-dependent oxidoreductase [Brucella sp. 21LCYQ03]
MEKVLVIVIHPDLESSVINKRWISELQQYPDRYHIHDLYHHYRDRMIDVEAEQRLVEQYDKIVFQFPLYWFSSPPLFKTCKNEVFTYGWAYGSKSGFKMAGKKIALAISAGVAEDVYMPEEKYKYTLDELTRPFELTFEYVKADYRPLFAYYDLELNVQEPWIARSVPLYMDFLNAL